MNNNWQPRIGQKVVALVDCNYGDYKKGDIFIVSDTQYCATCKQWKCSIGIKGLLAAVKCGKCDSIIQPLFTYEEYYNTIRFAPIISDAMEEILSQVQVIERYDGEPVSVPREVVEQSN